MGPGLGHRGPERLSLAYGVVLLSDNIPKSSAVGARAKIYDFGQILVFRLKSGLKSKRACGIKYLIFS